MKSLIKILSLFYFFSCLTLGYGQAIKVDSNDKVGISGDPFSGYELSVTGDMYVSTDISTNNLNIRGTSLDPTSGNLTIGDGGVNVGIGIAYDTYSTLKISGESNTYAIKVEGECLITGGIWQSSSGKLKKDIEDLDGKIILSKVVQLQAKSYYFKDKKELSALHEQGLVNFSYDTSRVVDTETGLEKEEVHLMVPHFPQSKQFGLIAEEVEPIFPELVMTDSITNMQAIDYVRMIPILIEAIKEQEEKINSLEEELKTLKES